MLEAAFAVAFGGLLFAAVGWELYTFFLTWKDLKKKREAQREVQERRGGKNWPLNL